MRLPTTAQLHARHATVRGALDALGLDALIVVAPANIRYLSNFSGTSGMLVLTGEQAHLLVDFRYREAARLLQDSAGACPGLRVWDVPGSYEEALVACLAEIGVAAAGFEAAHLTVARHDWWRRAIGARGLPLTLRSTERVVEQARVVKDAFEISAIRESAQRLDAVAHAAFSAARRGRSEKAVAAAIEGAMRDAGYERAAFDTIVASGPYAALPHHRAGARILADGDLVVLDFGGILDGYCSDLTRTISIGSPSAEGRRLYDAVYEAHQAAIAAVRPGTMSTAIDAAARAVLDRAGLGEAFGHGTGHGLGLEVHEDPRITRPRADVPSVAVASGMVFTIEPGAYVPGTGGVRIEDDVLVTEGGHEVLTSVPKELDECLAI